MPVMNLAERLLDEGREYGFFQALRLLRLRFDDDQGFRDGVRVRPCLGLGFPERDIESIDRDTEGRFWIEANFFGLYGVSSPLPTFYSEDLIDEFQGDGRVMRDFLDILHAELYPLLFQAWEKYRSWVVICERRDQRRLQQLYALIGLGQIPSTLQHDRPLLLRYAGLFNQYPRSALGLQTLVQGLLDGATVSVQSCVEHLVEINAPARCRLGQQAASLGVDSLLGTAVADRSSTLAIRIGGLSAGRFHELLPARRLHERLAQVIDLYLQTPIRCRLMLGLNPLEQPAASLGTGWQQLGLNTWLGANSVVDEVMLPLGADRRCAPPMEPIQ